ncbi:MAG: hypothetical protein ETSY1_40010 [Candidatus Entotheonella factor]|uniref:Sulfotransferase domain-containing protein n=2 Tax=Candidatus Entotheonella TaxID=93171 RepID=W4L5W1_ENTF1|nr:MAG: hypothetical protein ETSY1_40010 [Candidatus Entotheonella factor]
MPDIYMKNLKLNRGLRHHPLNYILFFNRTTVFAGVDQPRKIKLKTLEYKIKQIRNNSFSIGHMPYDPLVIDLLNKNRIKTLFMIRDPRDIVVSKMYYNVKRKRHFLHKHYQSLNSDKDRIKAAILGVKKPNGEMVALGIADKLRSVLAWLQTDNVKSVRFEDLIGDRGGGDQERQMQSLFSVAAHIGKSLTDEEVAAIGNQMFGQGHTFRSGSIGAWQNHFDTELKELFKKESGDQLIEFGYESNFDW